MKKIKDSGLVFRGILSKVYFTLGLVVLLSACSGTGEKKTAQEHMHKNSVSELIEKFEDPNRDQWQKPKIILDKLGEIDSLTVADIGAGSGYFSFKIAEKGATVLAVDISEEFLNFIEKKKDSLHLKNLRTVKSTVENPTLDSASVDKVLCVNTYHHIENRAAYFRKVWMAIKPGGELLIVDFKKKKTPNGPPFEMRVESFEVMRELQNAGFSKIVLDEKSLDFQYIISAKKYEKAI